MSHGHIYQIWCVYIVAEQSTRAYERIFFFNFRDYSPSAVETMWRLLAAFAKLELEIIWVPLYIFTFILLYK